MNHYVFLFNVPQQPQDSRSPQELQESMQRWYSWMASLAQHGHYVSGEQLATKPVKLVKGSKGLVTDGPFAEAKEVVGGFITVAAESWEAAQQLAKECPVLQEGGSVQVQEAVQRTPPAITTQAITRVFKAPQPVVYDYFANVNNLPEWSVNFCKEVKQVGQHTKIVIRTGPAQEMELFYDIKGNRQAGTLDFYLGQEADPAKMDVLPTRIIAKGEHTVVTMCYFQEHYMDEQMFLARTANVQWELNNMTEALFSKVKVAKPA